MLKILGYLIFIISAALTAGGIILSSRLRNRYKSDIFSTLLYFQVFIYTFGFYGIWGQVVIRMFLSEVISTEILTRISNIAILLGLPFLVFAWLMLIRFSGNLSGRKSSRWFILWFLSINFSILLVMGYVISKSSTGNIAAIIRDYYIILNLVHSFIASYLIHLPSRGRSVIHEHDRKIIAPSIFLIMIAQCVPLLFLDNQPWAAVVFIFAFFLGNTFLPFYFNYGTLLPTMASEPRMIFSIEDFCSKFDVSPRESDVVREICNGLSNKEISEKLFISLQTVKDHTHRIYIKTNVRSRVQLINMVKEVINK